MTLYSVLAAEHLSVNKFKTLDKTNKINTILCRLNFYLLVYLSVLHQKCEQTEYIAGAGVCGIKPKIVPRRPLHHRSDLIYHVKVTQTRRCGRVSKRNVKAPVLSLLTSESDINLSQGENSSR